jgi:hypothetical protein
MVLLSLPGEAASLTGAIVFGTDRSGNYQPAPTIGGIPRNNAWNTVGGDVPFNLYLTLNGLELNTGNGPETAINVPLDVGNTYEVSFAIEQPFASTFGLNLFFSGNTGNPGISAIGASFNPGGPPPISAAPFSANAAPFTADLFASFTPGAGTTVYRNGVVRVDLSVLEFRSTAGESVSAYSRTPGGNGPDTTGRFVIAVTADVPEPGTCALIASVPLVAAMRIRLRR